MKKIFCLLFVFTTLAIACKNEGNRSPDAIAQDPILFSKEGELYILDSDSTKIAHLDIEIAETPYEIETGLMYRNSMDTNEGMLFLFNREEPHSFYMKNTYIPLDIIYADASRRIVTIIKNAQPLDEKSLPSGVPIKYVLEVNAGSAEKWNLKEGDLLNWNRD